MTTPPGAIIRRVRFDELSAREFHALLWMRQSVLIVEQASPYPDIDGRDPDALHLIATRVQDGALVGCARVFGPDPEKGGATAFGRLAVRPEERKTGLGRRLVAESLAELTEHWPAQDVVIGAQLYLERFYGGFGFVRDSDVYDDGGIPHIDMRLRR
ncbi:GNAT family N-acetyltransferase [Azospirillum griseum]|uniref:GNAT family N-acetyltransferase n=1 Tax=Azospirillum griseum TaxID=2496639 RepID=A0A3S0JLS5_9PROT|nr:GNAT family N-acetyltransferase [Azospirillum griseum]RTR24248.1 GNAT family N-acetyltransferase [Azospirillum griseum]